MREYSEFEGVSGWEENRSERNWAMLCHLSTFAGLIVPFGNILGPLAVWWAKRDEFPLVRDQGLEALNFQISLTLYLVGAGLLSIVLVGLPVLFGLIAFDFVVTVLALLRTSEGKPYRYPLNLNIVG